MTASDLTVLCITEAGDHAKPFILDLVRLSERIGASMQIAVDSPAEDPWVTDTPEWMNGAVPVFSHGHIESVLDEALGYLEEGYVLRVDDDERVTHAMEDWLAAGAYREHDHWAFPRFNLWPRAETYITNPPLWPDLQTRLSVKAKSGGRHQVHVGSPFGTGHIAPVALEHHKFLVRSEAERRAIVDRYERLQPGAGRDYVMFSLPELYGDDIDTALVADADLG